MAAESGNILSRLLAWWFGELRACLPGPLERTLFPENAELDVALSAQEARFSLRGMGGWRDLGGVSRAIAETGEARAETEALLRKAGFSGGRVTLRLPPSEVLRPTVQLPVAAAESLREVLAFEMDRHTPFAEDDVCFDFLVKGSDPELERIEIEMLVARRRDVDRARALARSMGLTPDRVAGPLTAAPAGGALNLLPEVERPRPNRLAPRLALGLSVATAALAAFAISIWFDKKGEEAAYYQDEVGRLRATAVEVGALESRIDALREVGGRVVELRRAKPTMVEILDEVTRSLSDEHYLFSYSFREDTLQLAGYSSDPSSALRSLEQSPLFSEVRYGAPVTMDPRIGKDRFNIVAVVAREARAK